MEACLREVACQRPEFVPSRRSLIEHLLEFGRLATAAVEIERLAEQPHARRRQPLACKGCTCWPTGNPVRPANCYKLRIPMTPLWRSVWVGFSLKEAPTTRPRASFASVSLGTPRISLHIAT